MEKKIKAVLLILSAFIILAVLLYADAIYAQAKTSARFFIADTAVNRISKDHNVWPLWIGTYRTDAETVRVSVPYIISSDNERIKLENRVFPLKDSVVSDKMVQCFNVRFSRSQFSEIKSGFYKAVVIVSSKNIPVIRQYIPIYIKAPVSVGSVLSSFLTDSVALLLPFLKLALGILLLLLFIFAIRVIYSRIFRKKTLRVLPVTDETGDSSHYAGIASGIDDLLQSNIQDILDRMTKICQSISSGLKTLDESSAGERSAALNIHGSPRVSKDRKPEGKSKPITISTASLEIDLQKTGEIGVGIFKLPLGLLAGLFSRITVGHCVRGALQKFGSANRLILFLEKRSGWRLKRNVILFEGLWESDNLADGILPVIEELAYKLVMNISDDIKAKNWKAFKYFLEGNALFSDYEDNPARKDKLRDAVSKWEESIGFDNDFADAHFNLGVALDQDEKITDALSHYDKSISPDAAKQLKVKAYINMLKIYIRDLNDYDTARKLLENAKRLKKPQADLYNLEGLVLLNDKKFKKAAKCFKKTIRRSKRHAKIDQPHFHYNLSTAYLRLEKYAAAEKSCTKALRLFPKSERPFYLFLRMGSILYGKKEYRKSYKFFEKALSKDPENRDLLYEYSKSLLKLKRRKSLALLGRLLMRFPWDYEAHFLMSELVKADGGNDNTSAIFERIGNELKQSTGPTSALESLRKSYLSLMDNSFGQTLYAAVIGGINCFINPPNFRQSAEYLFRAVSSNDQDFKKLLLPGSLLIFGKVLMEIGNFKQSIDALINASKYYEEENSKLHYYDYELAVCYDILTEAYSGEALKHDAKNKKGMSGIKKSLNVKKSETANKEGTDFNQKAYEAFLKVIEKYGKLNMNSTASDVCVKHAKWLIDVKAYEVAQYYFDDINSYLSQALYLAPYNDYAFYYRGDTLFNSQNYKEAIFQYEQAAGISFDSPVTHYQLGLCHFYLGDYGKAADSFRTVLKLQKDFAFPDDLKSPDAYQFLAEALKRQKKFKEAEKALIEAINLYPGKAKYRLLLARIYKSIDRLQEAEKELKAGLILSADGGQNFRHLVLNELAETELDYGADYEKADDQIKEAVSIFENEGEHDETIDEELALLRNTLGWACFRLKKYDEAKELLEKTHSFFVGNAKAHSHLGLLYEKKFQISANEEEKLSYKAKAIEQWNSVFTFAAKDDLRKLAEEHIAELKKANNI